MSPPTEQLIRDYLNRLSVAARSRLGAEDRRALVDRTREFIERNVGDIGRADPRQAAALLSRLGDPAAIVEKESGRLLALRGETGQPASGPTRRSDRTRSSGRAARLRRAPGTASWHWPQASGSPTLQDQVLTGGVAAPPGNDHLTVLLPGQQDTAPGLTEAAAIPPFSAELTGLSEPALATAAGFPASSPAPALAEPLATAEPGPASRPRWPSMAPFTAEPALTAVAPQHAAPRRTSQSAVIVAGVLGWARAHPLEAAAAVLMGLGGAAYPPVWLLGAAVAFTSKVWDYRDRWIGLAGPLLILVIGTSAAVSLGSAHASFGGYVHESWVYADLLSRIGAVLGTYYLIWRVEHPRRAPEVPPWNRPHRVG